MWPPLRAGRIAKRLAEMSALGMRLEPEPTDDLVGGERWEGHRNAEQVTP